MRELLFKYLPIGAAIALIGLLVVVEPGLQRKLLIAGLCTFLALVWVVRLIARNLPAHPTIEPSTAELGGELGELCAKLQALGFEPVGAPVMINVAPPALLVGFVHAREPIYATAFVAGSAPITTFDMVSVLDGDRGGLTTSPNPLAATLPAERGTLRQILPQGSPEEVFAMHVEGLTWLREHALATRPVDATTFVADITSSMTRQREAFSSAPFLYAAIALKRSILPTSRYSMPIHAQREVRRQIEWLHEAKGDLPRASARFR